MNRNQPVRKFIQVLGSTPITIGLVLSGIVIAAILFKYPGLIEMRFGVDGGQLRIDGRPKTEEVK